MLKRISIVVAVCAISLLAYAATKPDTFHVQRSASINAPPEKVFSIIDNFSQWPSWSPWEKIDPAMKKTLSGTANGKGAVSGMSAVARLPDEVSITISRNGSAPTQITVKNKEQSWEITEKELDKLPADIRKHVESMLSPRNSAASSGKAWTARIATPDAYGRPGSTDPAHQLQERQEAMLKQLQQLTEKVEKLQQALEKSAPKP